MSITDYITHQLELLPDDCGSSEIRVPSNISIPVAAAGYTPGHLAHDVLGSFLTPPQPRRRLKEVVAAWKDHAIAHRKAPLAVRARAVAFARFFSRFSHSQLREDFLAYHDNDPQWAAQAFLDWVASEASRAGREQTRDGGAWLGKLLSRFGRGLNIPFAPPQDGAGSEHGTLIERALHVAELLPRVRKRYEFAAVRGVRRERVDYPDDDFDLRPLRDWSEIARLPVSQLMLTDAEFYPRAARRELLTYEHQHVIPEPRAYTLLVDVSGSMDDAAGASGYQRAEWATAVGIALCEQAQRGGNRVTLIRFDQRGFPPARGTARQIADEVWRCKFSGGGTNYEGAFRAADEAEASADAVVMITDGVDATWQTPPRAALYVLQADPDVQRDDLARIAARYEKVVNV